VTDAGTMEVTETIEHLDLEFTCTADDCEAKAEWVYFGGCPCTQYACTPHKEEWLGDRDAARERYPDAYIAAVCTRCGQECAADEVQAWPL
jgi:hypothetical protein